MSELIKYAATLEDIDKVEQEIKDSALPKLTSGDIEEIKAQWNPSGGGGGGGSSVLDYSTTEQATGRKWVDGSDIYVKTVLCTSGNEADTAHGISNFGRLVSKEVVSANSDQYGWRTDMAYYSGATWDCCVYVNATNIRVEAGSNWASAHPQVYVTIYYTKQSS